MQPIAQEVELLSLEEADEEQAVDKAIEDEELESGAQSE